ncbi:exodeoxyribonuclease VII large subunit [Rhodonellum sp.]|uniref:exodeoxyribonuclease VII large subunit n=1 Tax=Rhodonellum sp. TaxID=2231180 RepID=UPI002722D4C9|nr:exodeoxyribonuclease VII large subunit [Rhodonellum sp.]MDO9554292.1 exodeoxyribonuclease VII large subunit [Rhodonellum sp.]
MQQALSLLDLNQLIRSTLDEHLHPSYWVVAEIGEFKQVAQGHAYLDLVEKKGSQIAAKIRANIWQYTYRVIAGRFSAVTGQNLKAGMKILAQVNVTFHEVYGISLNIKDIDPNYTLGERARIRQEVIERLTREGLMDLNKRFPLPLVPQKIAIISSASAAGYGDFMDQLLKNRQGYQIHAQLFQATLQGADAAATIIRALDQIDLLSGKESFDAVVLIRGGGSQLDLDCFDDYGLAATIAKYPLPVITGIGHERDETIVDLVAHTRLKTPTATAEFILSGFRDFEEQLNTALKTLERATSQKLLMEDRRLRDMLTSIKTLADFSIQRQKENLNYKTNQLKSLSSNLLKMDLVKINNLEMGIRRSWKSRVDSEDRKLENLERDLQKLDPNTFLAKGYTRSEVNGIPINKTEVQIGDTLVTFAKNISLKSIIQNIETNGNTKL